MGRPCLNHARGMPTSFKKRRLPLTSVMLGFHPVFLGTLFCFSKNILKYEERSTAGRKYYVQGQCKFIQQVGTGLSNR